MITKNTQFKNQKDKISIKKGEGKLKSIKDYDINNLDKEIYLNSLLD